MEKIIIIIIIINLWLTAPKGATVVNYTSVTDWQMAARGIMLLAICSVKSNNGDLLNQIRYF